MRKLHPNQDNPVDNFLIDLADKVCPILYKIGMTPNVITLLSAITGMMAAWILFKYRSQKVWTSIALIIISYWLDCLDGHYARKYNMVTAFGDYLDHICDTIKSIALACVLLYINPRLFWKTLPLSVILGIMMLSHIGCQERTYCNNDESDMLSITKNLCPDTDTIHFTRYFGVGTFMIYECILVWSICQTT